MISARCFVISQKACHSSMACSSIVIEDLATTYHNHNRSFSSPAVRRYKRRQKEAAKSQPCLGIASSMTAKYDKMDNQVLIRIAAMKNHEARAEVLKRHIMAVDKVSYDEACITFKEIEEKNDEASFQASVPYYIGIGVPAALAIISIPMVFHLGTAEWFNEIYVTTDVPEPRDLETPLEVGAWTWNWMEPPLVQSTFLLLCLQFSRAQMKNLGAMSFTQKLKKIRAKNLCRSYPQYDANIIEAFSETDGLHPKTFIPSWLYSNNRLSIAESSGVDESKQLQPLQTKSLEEEKKEAADSLKASSEKLKTTKDTHPRESVVTKSSSRNPEESDDVQDRNYTIIVDKRRQSWDAATSLQASYR